LSRKANKLYGNGKGTVLIDRQRTRDIMAAKILKRVKHSPRQKMTTAK